MILTIDLQPEIERILVAKAQARGVSPADLVEEIVEREVKATPLADRRTGQSLIDACAKVRGILSDEEVDTLFARSPSRSRPVDFE